MITQIEKDFDWLEDRIRRFTSQDPLQVPSDWALGFWMVAHFGTEDWAALERIRNTVGDNTAHRWLLSSLQKAGLRFSQREGKLLFIN